jgi:acetoin utilization protein AcuB
MEVKNRMTPNPITATPTTTHREAVQLMKNHQISRLPILDKSGKLVGIVTGEDLHNAEPSKATTLSVYEIRTLLDKMELKQIMSSPVLAVQEDCSLTTAAQFMIENRVSALPVMHDDKLIGIITEADIFKTVVEVMGGGEPGFRVEIEIENEIGSLANICKAFADINSSIVSLTTFRGLDQSTGIISIKERGADEAQLREMLGKLECVKILTIRPNRQDELLKYG